METILVEEEEFLPILPTNKNQWILLRKAWKVGESSIIGDKGDHFLEVGSFLSVLYVVNPIRIYIVLKIPKG